QVGVRSVRFEAAGPTGASVRWTARGAAAVGTHWHVGAGKGLGGPGIYEPPHDLAFRPDRRLAGRSRATIATAAPTLMLHGWADPAPPSRDYRTLFTATLPRPAA
ncbi:MAG TPA: hypothetical protein VN238_03075, partial [Solirubrobacteraceae bacterium]|nr:hypothetical protein [Solirubrobacteraceae bacterium]